jgi:DNA-binding response OmpR family regulator
LKLYSWVLNRAGYRAVTALVGSNSVNFPNATRINLAILDYRLQSQLKAQDVLKQIRVQFNGVPVILLSELQWMPKDMENLVDAFQQKGHPEMLLSKIAELTPGSQEAGTYGEHLES